MRSIPFVLAAFAFSAPALAQSWDEYSYPEYAISVAASAVSGSASEPSPALLRLRRSCIGPPVLKNGIAFSGTDTVEPLRGFLPLRACLNLIANTPNPRSSTRSPRASALQLSRALRWPNSHLAS